MKTFNEVINAVAVKINGNGTAANSQELIAAAKRGDLPKVWHLLPISDAKAVNEVGMSALMVASQRGHADIVALLMPVSDTQAKDGEYGWSALAFAAAYGHVESVKILLATSDANSLSAYGRTALMAASWNAHHDVVKLLLPITDTGIKDVDGRTAADHARLTGNMATAGIIEGFAVVKAQALAPAESVSSPAKQLSNERRARSLEM